MAFDWDAIEEETINTPKKVAPEKGVSVENKGSFDWDAIEEESKEPTPVVQESGKKTVPQETNQYKIGLKESLATFMSAPSYVKQLMDVGLFKDPREYWNALNKKEAEAPLKEEYGIANVPEPTNLNERFQRTAGALTLPTIAMNPALGAASAGALGAAAGAVSIPAAIGLGAGLSEGGGEVAAKGFGEEYRPYGQLAGSVLSIFPQIAVQRGIDKAVGIKSAVDVKSGSVAPVFKDISETSGLTPLSQKIDELDATLKATSPELAASPYMLVSENPVLLDTVKRMSTSGIRSEGISGAKVQGQAISKLETSLEGVKTGSKAKLGIDPNAEQNAYELARRLGTPEGELVFFSESPVVQRANVVIEKANADLNKLGFNVRAFSDTSDTGSAVKTNIETAIESKRKALSAQFTPILDKADNSGIKYAESDSQQLLDTFSEFKDSKLFTSFPTLWNKVQSTLAPKVVGREVKKLQTPTGFKEVVTKAGVREYPELKFSDLHNLKQELGKIGWGRDTDIAPIAKQLYKTVDDKLKAFPDEAVTALYSDLNRQYATSVHAALDLKTVSAMSQDVWDSTVSGYLTKPQTIRDMLKATELVGGDVANTTKLIEEALTSRLAKTVVDIDGRVSQSKFNTFFEQHKEALSVPELAGVRDKLLGYRNQAMKLTEDIAEQESKRAVVRKQIADSALVRMAGRGLDDTASAMRANGGFFDETIAFSKSLPENSKEILLQSLRENYLNEAIKNGKNIDEFLKAAPNNRQYSELFGKNLSYVRDVAKVHDEIERNLSVIKNIRQPVVKALSDKLENQTGISLSQLGGWMSNQIQSARWVAMQIARKTVLYKQDQQRVKKLYSLLNDSRAFNALLKRAEAGGNELSTLDKLVQFVQDKGLGRTILDATGKAVTATGGAVPEAMIRGSIVNQFTTDQAEEPRKGLFSQ